MASAARTHGGHPAVEADDGAATYAELDAAASATARRLAGLGVGRGDRVASTLAAGLDLVTLVHAVARVGAALVPLNTRLSEPERRAQREHAAARVVLSELPAGDQAELESDGSLDPGAVRAVVHTSGSAGRPKAVELTNANLHAGAAASAAHLGTEPGDRWLCVLPLFHVGGLAITIRSALDRATVVVYESFDAGRVLGALEGGQITLVSLVPTMLARLRDAGLERAPSLRALLLGGGPSPPELVQWAHALGLPVLPTYGMTETASQVATAGPGEPGARPLAGAELSIGAGGEILVRGPMVATGELAEDGWLHTGDAGRIDSQGRLHVEGRLKDVIVTGGENVSPVEVEDALLSHPCVADAAVLGTPDPEWGEAVSALVVLRAEASPEELIAHCRGLLAAYKLPKRVRAVGSLPRNAAGKLVRGRLEP